MNKLLFGTDPESFAGYQKDGKYYTLPPYYFRKYLGVPASNDKKHPVFLEGDGWKLHEDGAAFEMSVRPSHSPRDLYDVVQECANAASDRILSAFPDECDPTLKFFPTIGFEVERWANEGKDFFMSTTFGCDPDEDAFDTERKARVIDAGKFPQRFGGGHIHVSGHPMIEQQPILATRVAAITAGCAAVAFSDVPDLEKERTFLYGRPGKFRVQRYGSRNPFGPEYAIGIEYRTTSNRMFSNWNIAKKVFEWMEIGISLILPSDKANMLVAKTADQAVQAIMEADQDSARNVLAFLETQI